MIQVQVWSVFHFQLLISRKNSVTNRTVRLYSIILWIDLLEIAGKYTLHDEGSRRMLPFRPHINCLLSPHSLDPAFPLSPSLGQLRETPGPEWVRPREQDRSRREESWQKHLQLSVRPRHRWSVPWNIKHQLVSLSAQQFKQKTEMWKTNYQC